MMASARYPKLDKSNPAMFSEKIVTGLLREQMGYEGVVITDDVNAEALADVPAGDRAVRHVAAGGDIVLTGAASDAEVMLEALAAEAAVGCRVRGEGRRLGRAGAHPQGADGPAALLHHEALTGWSGRAPHH